MAPSRRSLYGLDLLNFFSADVHAGVGAFLAIYLQATRHWDPGSIGIAFSAAGFGAIIAQTPLGWLVDRLHRKRELVVLVAGMIAVGCLAILWLESWENRHSSGLYGRWRALFSPLRLPGSAWVSSATAASTAGSAGTSRSTTRETLLQQLPPVLTGFYFSQSWIFYSIAATSVASMLAHCSYERGKSTTSWREEA